MILLCMFCRSDKMHKKRKTNNSEQRCIFSVVIFHSPLYQICLVTTWYFDGANKKIDNKEDRK